LFEMDKVIHNRGVEEIGLFKLGFIHDYFNPLWL